MRSSANLSIGAPPSARWQSRYLAWIAALLAVALLMLFGDAVPWAMEYPKELVVPLKGWISKSIKWLINDLDFGLFTFQEFTRGISWVLDQPYRLVRALLVEGFPLPWGDKLRVPPVSWIGVVVTTALMARFARDWRLALLVGLSFLYLVLFGQWESAMVTLSSILIAVPVGVATGLLLGIWAYRAPWFERLLTPVLDLMQTVPIFAYLVPVLLLFGFGPVAAMVATVVYAMPPMARVSVLALKQVPPDIVEFGRMAGCSPRQMTWKVMIPAARPTLLVGVNQVIMLSLNMVIIASMIGAGGLGFDVLTALKRLQFGEGIEAGIAITLLAIALDRLSQATAMRPPPEHKEIRAGWARRHPHLVLALTLIVAMTALGLVVPAVAAYPESATLTTGQFWNKLVEWININFFDEINAAKSWLLLHLLIPFKRFLVSLPWIGVVGLLALAGYRLGGYRLALVVAGLGAFVAVVGIWEKAMVTTYLCGISVLVASTVGITLGLWAGRNDRAHRVLQVIVDLLQTLPSFVYLMPVVMLFQVGDFSAMIAVIAYAVAPAIRYTDHGIRQVPYTLIEAAKAAGCTRGQILRKIQIPVALPEIMLGINQTIMLALSMLVITALVGTRDLGQEALIGLVKADAGRGIVAGLGVACIAMIADRLIRAWAREKKRRLGLAD